MSVGIFLLSGLSGIFRQMAGSSLISLLTTAMIFRLRHIGAVFRVTGYLLIYAFLFGGMMKNLPYDQRSIWYILGIGMLGYLLVSWWLEQTGKRNSPKICRVHLSSGIHQQDLYALIDTGNSLREPISGKPVIIMDLEVWEAMPELRVAEKLKLIPYHSIGKAHGMMEGYEIPELVIEQGDVRLEWQKVIAGMSQTRIAADGRYQVILHPELCSTDSV